MRIDKSIKNRYDIVNEYIAEWRIIADFLGLRAGSAVVEVLGKLEKGTDIEGTDVGAVKRLADLLDELRILRNGNEKHT